MILNDTEFAIGDRKLSYSLVAAVVTVPLGLSVATINKHGDQVEVSQMKQICCC